MGHVPPAVTVNVTEVPVPGSTRPTWIRPLVSTAEPLTDQPGGSCGVKARLSA